MIIDNQIITVRPYGVISRYVYHLNYKGCYFEKKTIKEICYITGWNIKTMQGVYGRLNNKEEVFFRGSKIKKVCKYQENNN